MYPNYRNMNNYPGNFPSNQNDDRLIGGGFLGPFILGGITGGLLAPGFNNGFNNRPCCYNNYYQPVPYYPPRYPYYGGYYR